MAERYLSRLFAPRLSGLALAPHEDVAGVERFKLTNNPCRDVKKIKYPTDATVLSQRDTASA
jgi:hypothetical protein